MSQSIPKPLVQRCVFNLSIHPCWVQISRSRQLRRSVEDASARHAPSIGGPSSSDFPPFLTWGDRGYTVHWCGACRSQGPGATPAYRVRELLGATGVGSAVQHSIPSHKVMLLSIDCHQMSLKATSRCYQPCRSLCSDSCVLCTGLTWPNTWRPPGPKVGAIPGRTNPSLSWLLSWDHSCSAVASAV